MQHPGFTHPIQAELAGRAGTGGWAGAGAGAGACGSAGGAVAAAWLACVLGILSMGDSQQEAEAKSQFGAWCCSGVLVHASCCGLRQQGLAQGGSRHACPRSQNPPRSSWRCRPCNGCLSPATPTSCRSSPGLHLWQWSPLCRCCQADCRSHSMW